MIDDRWTRLHSFASTGGASGSMTLPVQSFDRTKRQSLDRRPGARTAAGPVMAMRVRRRWWATSLVLAAPPMPRLADPAWLPAGRAGLSMQAGGGASTLIFQELTRPTSSTYTVTADKNGLDSTKPAQSDTSAPSLPSLADLDVRGRGER